MSQVFSASTTEGLAAIQTLLANKPPLLIEVRFPNMGTSPDWHLCDDEGQVEQLLDRLGAGVELHISSVWDLRSNQEDVCLRK